MCSVSRIKESFSGALRLFFGGNDLDIERKYIWVEKVYT